MQKSFNSFERPRDKAILLMKESISSEQWSKNENFLRLLREKISNHPVSKHKAIDVLNSGKLNLDAMKRIHLEYRHAIVQIFTDALLMAQHQTKQLEPRLSPGAKMPPRFLLTLNILDEFGFRAGSDSEGSYLGNPEYAHYPLFEDVLSAKKHILKKGYTGVRVSSSGCLGRCKNGAAMVVYPEGTWYQHSNLDDFLKTIDEEFKGE